MVSNLIELTTIESFVYEICTILFSGVPNSDDTVIGDCSVCCIFLVSVSYPLSRLFSIECVW